MTTEYPPGWTPIEAGFPDSFVSADPDGDRLRVRYFTDEAGTLAALVTCGPRAAGPPGHAHGGAMAAVLDEVMGVAAWLAGHPVVAARLAVDFRRMLPLGTEARVETVVHPAEGRKVRVTARLSSDAGLHAEGEALFVHLGEDTMQHLNTIRLGEDA